MNSRFLRNLGHRFRRKANPSLHFSFQKCAFPHIFVYLRQFHRESRFLQKTNEVYGKETHVRFVVLYQEGKQNKRNEAAIYLRITVDSSRVEISTKIYVDAEKWLPGVGRVKGKTEDVVRLNNAITNFEHRGREIYNRFIENGS